MFIEHTAYTNILSPRGATCNICLNHGLPADHRLANSILHLAPEGRIERIKK